MATKKEKLSKAGKTQEVKRDEKGRLLPGVSLNPTGMKKGTKHGRTLFEEYLKERVIVKKKILKELEDGTFTEEDVQTVMTRFDAILDAQYKKAVEKGDGYLMAYITDQYIGKATQTNRLEGGFSLRGFELNPEDEAEVDDLFAIETHGKKKNTKNHKGGSR